MRRLTLSKETVAELTAAELSAVAAGLSGAGCLTEGVRDLTAQLPTRICVTLLGGCTR